MVFSPHPDDDLLGCGGSMAKHIHNGHEVYVVYMTSGDAGSLQYSKDQLTLIREKEARQAALLLGIKETIFLRNPDGYLEYNRENLVRLINLLRLKKPDLVYLPHQRDGHEDHRATSKLALEACRRAGGPWFQECQGEPWKIQTILGYEVWTPLAEVSWAEDITPYMDQKIEALRLHASQIGPIQYDEAIRSFNRYRGIMTGQGQFCECFQVLKFNPAGRC